jgi:hypothetical protein
VAASPDLPRPPVWKSRSGFVRSRIDEQLILGVKGCLRDYPWEATCFLVDYTGRLFRTGKAVISAELANIFDRLGTTADSWWSRLEKLSQGQLLGRYFAAKRERLREVARDLGVHHLANLGGCPAR